MYATGATSRRVKVVRYDLLHPKALRAALIKHMGEDYPVPQERQVRRWISGDNPWPGWARKAVDEIHGITKEAAPPDWAERLEAKVDQLVIGAIADPEQREVVRRLAARLGVLPRPSAEGFDDLPDTEDPDAVTPGGQGSS